MLNINASAAFAVYCAQRCKHNWNKQHATEISSVWLKFVKFYTDKWWLHCVIVQQHDTIANTREHRWSMATWKRAYDDSKYPQAHIQTLGFKEALTSNTLCSHTHFERSQVNSPWEKAWCSGHCPCKDIGVVKPHGPCIMYYWDASKQTWMLSLPATQQCKVQLLNALDYTWLLCNSLN